MNWGGNGNQFADSRMSSFSSPGGGGFLDKTYGESPASQEKRERKNPCVVPITGAGILNATHEPGTDGFTLNEVPLHQVTLIGMVSSITENRTHLSFEIDDLTGGTITVKRWIDQDENAEEYEEARFREDAHVRVCGYIKRVDDDKRHIVAFAMYPVTDYNELTFHMYDVINSHLSIRKSMHEEDNAKAPDSTTNFANNSFSARGDQVGPESGNRPKSQNRVYQMINQVTEQEGISISDLTTRLNMSEQAVRESIEHLSDEGHVYSTTDDDHFRSTNAGE